MTCQTIKEGTSNDMAKGLTAISAGVLLGLCVMTVVSIDNFIPGVRHDMGGPLPVGTEMFKRTGIMAKIFGPGRVITDHRIWVSPENDFDDPVLLTDFDAGKDFYMSRADYRNAKVRCNSSEACRAYLAEGNEGIRKVEEHRLAVNNDMSNDRYIFCDGMEMWGGGYAGAKEKRND